MGQKLQTKLWGGPALLVCACVFAAGLLLPGFCSPCLCCKQYISIQQNSMKNGYDENNNYNMSDETKV